MAVVPLAIVLDFEGLGAANYGDFTVVEGDLDLSPELFFNSLFNHLNDGIHGFFPSLEIQKPQGAFPPLPEAQQSRGLVRAKLF
jgi:hypothetical protein